MRVPATLTDSTLAVQAFLRSEEDRGWHSWLVEFGPCRVVRATGSTNLCQDAGACHNLYENLYVMQENGFNGIGVNMLAQTAARYITLEAFGRQQALRGA